MDEVNSSTSSTRWPKAKARPRRGGEAVGGGINIIRYDTAHDCRNMAENHRGKSHVCGGEIKELGLASHDEVVETITRMTSARDTSLPQRGDAPKFPLAPHSFHGYSNPSYKNMGDNVKCGLVEPLPTKGASFAHEDWGIVQAA